MNSELFVSNTDTQLLYLHSIILGWQLSFNKLFKLAAQYNFNYEQIWNSRNYQLFASVLKPREFADFQKYIQKTDITRNWKLLSTQHINIIDYTNPHYPELLRQITNPPLALYYMGTLTNLFPIAIVGSRKPSSYGIAVSKQLVTGLAGLPLSIISGLAYGIDATVHMSALVSGIHTIAVLGSGIDDLSIYPKMHIPLAHRIIEAGGAVISEFPPGTKPTKYSFPQRNRIIAGLAQATLIIEATIPSGALITAQLALDENRDVFAIPGSLYNSLATGPNMLLKQGAIVTTDAFDIIVRYEKLFSAFTLKNNTAAIKKYRRY